MPGVVAVVLLAGMAGLVYGLRLGPMSTDFGGGDLVLYAVAAAVIGGTSLLGGLGSRCGRCSAAPRCPLIANLAPGAPCAGGRTVGVGRLQQLVMSSCSCNNVRMSHRSEPELAFLSAATARSVAETMQALATPGRVRILSPLAAGPCSVGELARDVGMEQSAVSQQLRVVRHLGLVGGERNGRQIFYALHDDHVRALLAEAVSHTDHLRLGLAPSPSQEAVSA